MVTLGLINLVIQILKFPVSKSIQVFVNFEREHSQDLHTLSIESTGLLKCLPISRRGGGRLGFQVLDFLER